jgi:hypothetical protein
LCCAVNLRYWRLRLFRFTVVRQSLLIGFCLLQGRQANFEWARFSRELRSGWRRWGQLHTIVDGRMLLQIWLIAFCFSREWRGIWRLLNLGLPSGYCIEHAKPSTSFTIAIGGRRAMPVDGCQAGLRANWQETEVNLFALPR